MQQAASDQELDCDKACGRGITDSPPILMPFNEEIGLSADMPDRTSVLDFFMFYLTMICEGLSLNRQILTLKDGSKMRD